MKEPEARIIFIKKRKGITTKIKISKEFTRFEVLGLLDMIKYKMVRSLVKAEKQTATKIKLIEVGTDKDDTGKKS